LSHRGIADVVDWGKYEDRAYVVTRAQGRSLKTIVEAGGPLAELEAVDLVRELADALIYLHEHELVYQAVNPLSAFVGSDGRRAPARARKPRNCRGWCSSSGRDRRDCAPARPP